MSGIMDFVSGLFKPASELIDNVHTSDEERLNLKNQFALIQNGLLEKLLDYEKKLAELQSDVIKTEATSGSWIQKNWRPITMLTFLILVVLNQFKLLPMPLPESAWTLLEIGLGGYVIGRSVEKTAPAITKILKK